MNRLFLIIILAFYFISSQAFSQDSTNAPDGEFNFIRSKVGVRILYNVDGSHFYFDVPCKDFKEIDVDELIFYFDDVLIQITPVPIKSLTTQKPETMSDTMALVLHQISEMKSIRAQIKGKFDIDYLMWVDENKRTLNSWEFEMPGIANDTSSVKIRRQYFATTRIGDRILMLSSAMTKSSDRDAVVKKVKDALLSIYTQGDKIDPEELRKQMESGK